MNSGGIHGNIQLKLKGDLRSISCPQERSEMTVVTITPNVSSLKWDLPSSSQTGSPS